MLVDVKLILMYNPLDSLIYKNASYFIYISNY